MPEPVHLRGGNDNIFELTVHKVTGKLNKSINMASVTAIR
jgi:hypothetical protein